jgi:hypothetical protein
MQVSCEVTMHVAFGRQHPPVGGAHVVLAHTVPGPWNTPCCAVHCSAERFWHTVPPAALGRQHAPVTHVVFVHGDPGPWNTPFCAAHCAEVSCWQTVPAAPAMQHAPAG